MGKDEKKEKVDEMKETLMWIVSINRFLSKLHGIAFVFASNQGLRLFQDLKECYLPGHSYFYFV